MLKNKVKKISALLSVFLLIFTFSEIIYAEDEVLYTAMGDSIAAGYGLQNPDDGYVSLLSTELKLTTQNLAVSGIDSGSLLKIIKDLKGKELENLKNSKLITVSIGSNDILGPFLNFLSSLGIYKEHGSEALFKKAEYYTEAAVDYTALTLEVLLMPYINTFAENLPVIVKELRRINPSAQIVFTDFYNPFKNLEIAYINVDVGAITDRLIRLLNNVLYSDGSDFSIAAVYDAFEKSFNEGISPVNVSVISTEFSLDPHPNAYGHFLIKEAVEKVISIEELYMT